MMIKRFSLEIGFLVCTLFLIFILSATSAKSESVILRGTILCNEAGDPTRERPLNGEWLLVVPHKFPYLAVLPDDKGLFNLTLPKSCINSNVAVLLKCRNKTIYGFNRFIAEEELRDQGKTRIHKLAEPIILANACASLYVNIDSCLAEQFVLNNSTHKPKNKKSAAGMVIGTLGTLGTVLASVLLSGTPGQPPPSDTTFSESLGIKSIKFPKADLASLISRHFWGISSFSGINFSPRYNYDKAFFQNASSLILAHSNIINLYANLPNPYRFYQGGGFIQISSKLGLGVGFTYFNQNKKTTAFTETGLTYSQILSSRATVCLVPLAVRINNKISVGISPKYAWQNISVPVDVIKIILPGDDYATTHFRTESERSNFFDVDVSMTFSFTPAIRLGLGLSGLLGGSYIGQEGEKINSRSYGIGFSIKKRQLLFGGDLLVAEQGDCQMAMGCNYIFNNYLDFYTSILTLQNSFQVGTSFKFKVFKLNYTFNHSKHFNTSHLLGINFAF